MTDLTTFERLIADVATEAASAPRPVDAVAIVRSATSTASEGRWSDITRRLRGGIPPASTEGGFSMFSALKFVAAAAIVALFGGFLLAGVFTTPQDDDTVPAAVTASASPEAERTAPPPPMTTDDLLSGFVTDEVEPGVLRVVNDGVRDIAITHEEASDLFPATNIIAGLDGSVWVQDGERLLRLGKEGSVEYDFGRSNVPWWAQSEAVAADGILWVAAKGLLSHDGEKWVKRATQRPSGLVAAPDGAVWATWESEQGPRLGRFDGKARSVIDMPKVFRDGADHSLAVTDDGDVWVSATGAIHRYDGKTWRKVKDPNVGPNTAMSRDGTLWNTSRAGPFNAMGYRLGAVNRFDGTKWQRWDDVDDYPGAVQGYRRLEVMPDGRLWVLPAGPLTVGLGYCDGVAHFDGDSWTHYLQGRCVFSGDMAPDGSAWVQAADAVPAPQEIGRGGFVFEPTNPIHTYVITPEAVAAAE